MEIDKVENREIDYNFMSLKQENRAYLIKVSKQSSQKLDQDEAFITMPSLSQCFDEFASLTLPKPSEAQNII